jgi:hypothetical protein
MKAEMGLPDIADVFTGYRGCFLNCGHCLKPNMGLSLGEITALRAQTPSRARLAQIAGYQGCFRWLSTGKIMKPDIEAVFTGYQG